MAVLCYKPSDVLKACESSDLQMLSGALLINLKAFKYTKSATKKFTLEDITVVDPDTGLYPIAGSGYMPISIEWAKNAVKANYEVVSSDVKEDKYVHIASGLIISNSETDAGKENTMALSTEKWVLVTPMSGVSDADDKFQVLGAKNGLRFVVEPTSDDAGGRVMGSLRSLTGGAEFNPNGYNFLLAGGIVPTETLFRNKFNIAIV